MFWETLAGLAFKLITRWSQKKESRQARFLEDLGSFVDGCLSVCDRLPQMPFGREREQLKSDIKRLIGEGESLSQNNPLERQYGEPLSAVLTKLQVVTEGKRYDENKTKELRESCNRLKQAIAKRKYK